MISVGTEEVSRSGGVEINRFVMEMERGDAAGRGQIRETDPARLTQPRLRHGSKQFRFLYNKFADAGTDAFSIQSTHIVLATHWHIIWLIGTYITRLGYL